LESRLLLHAGHDHLDAPAVYAVAPAPDAPSASAPKEACGCGALEPHEAAEQNTPPQSPPTSGPLTGPISGRVTQAVGDPLLPDIFPWASEADGYFYGYRVTDGTTLPGRTLLEFSSAIANDGLGPMYLRGGQVNNDGTQTVLQRIMHEGGGFHEVVAGTFTYHPAHSHIHFDDYGSYKLKQVLPGGGVWPEVASGAKVSFCLIDVDQYNLSLPNARPVSTPSPFSCGQTQGISVGWADVYGQGTDGQWIDVTDVPEGQYWLEVVVDVNNRLQESDETNNTLRILIDLDKPSPDPSVRTHSPSGTTETPVSSIEFDFDEPMNTSSFSVADDVASFTGPGGLDLRPQITGFTWVDNDTLRVSFNTRTADGTYTMVLGPQILSADNGRPMDQDGDETPGEATQDRYTATFAIDLPNPNPAVAAHRPNGATLLPLTNVEFDFNEPMNTSSFSVTDDVASFTGPGGADLRPQITGFAWVNNQTLRVNFTAQSAGGNYSMAIGPQILAADNGNAMDLDEDGVLGEVTQDRYTAPFAGSDGFGYVAYVAPFDPINLVPGGAGVVNTGIAGDDTTTSLNLGTNTFNFYGTNYGGVGQVQVSSNGLITFGGSSSEYDNSDLTTSPTQRTIAVLWDDWDLSRGATSEVLYKIEDNRATGGVSRLIIEWNDVPHYDGSTNNPTNTATYQAILQLNTGSSPGAILLNYPDADAGSATWNNGASATVGIKDVGTQGVNRLVVSRNTAAGPIASGRAVRIVKGPLPGVTASAFDYAAAVPALRYTFSQNVSASLDPGDLAVQRLGGGTVAATGVTYNAATNTATFTFAPGSLADGNYRATLGAAGVWLSGTGASLLADQVTEFFILAGDVNRDRAVNGTDFAMLAANFGKAGMTYDKGDVNGDGNVNGSDFALLAGNFGKSLPPPAAAVIAPPAPVPAVTVRKPPAPATRAAPRRLVSAAVAVRQPRGIVRHPTRPRRQV
jgi:hypothetical protein